MALVILMTLYAGGLVRAVELPSYGGYQTGNYPGVDGYLRQSGTTSTSGLHAVWINLCAHDDCREWVQTGTIQGTWAGGSNPSQVMIYRENVNPCDDYYPANVSVPPTPDYAYYLSYDNTGQHSVHCLDDPPSTGYYFEYRKGSWNSPPFFVGSLRSSDGIAGAKIEVQAGAPIGNDFLGCDHNMACNDPGYGLHLLTTGSGWQLWTAPSTLSESGPPWVYTYHNYWAFVGCPVFC